MAQAAAIAPRLIICHVTEGMWNSAARPAPGAATFGPIFSPLDPFKSQVRFLDGLNMLSRDKGPGGDGHKRGVPHMFTGIEMVDANNAGGPSIDQKIAKVIGVNSQFGSLQFGVRVVYTDTNGRPIWSDASRVVPAMQDPFTAYAKIFGAAGAPVAGGGAAKFDLRKSALDYAIGDVTSLRTRLAGADRDRLDSYQESLRDIERRLSTVKPPAPVTGGVACTGPTLGATVDAKAEANYPKVGQLQMDLMVSALQCGLTRVASLQWGNSNDQATYSWLGVNALGHDLAHNNGGVDPSGAKKTIVYNWYAKQFAYLLGKLQSIPEGAGTMLDNTVILWASEFSDSNGHKADKLLWLLMGNANGYFKPGAVTTMAGKSTNDVHTTIQNAFGIADKTFGGAAYNTGPLTGLVA